MTLPMNEAMTRICMRAATNLNKDKCLDNSVPYILEAIHRDGRCDASHLFVKAMSTLRLREAVQKLKKMPPVASPPEFKQRAIGLATRAGAETLTPEHVLLTLLNSKVIFEVLVQTLAPATSKSSTLEMLRDTITMLVAGGKSAAYPVALASKVDVVTRQATTWKGRLVAADSPLRQFGQDLTESARDGKLDPVIGRENEIARAIRILVRKTKKNPVLIGDPGVGKTAIAEGLAQRIIAGDVPKKLMHKRIIMIQVGELVAGTQYRGSFEERLNKIVKEAVAGGDILFIDEIHMLVGSGKAEGNTDGANILKPALARGELSVMGATTHDEYRKVFAKDKALDRRFGRVLISPSSVVESLEILKGLRKSLQDHHQVTITDGAIDAAVRLSDRYVTDRFLPDKAIDFLDEACSYISGVIERSDSADERIVDSQHVARAISDATGIPATSLSENEQSKLLELEERMGKYVIGQDQALEAVADAVRCARTDLADPGRPMGSFLFLGSTGVGKTELAKALQQVLFDDDSDVLAFDMSEYKERNSVTRLIGAMPGYVGYEEAGQLTEAVRRKPYSVVLFDELEKSCVEVQNLLLQILEEGRLTDSQGKVVDFSNTIVIFTSNCGAIEMKQSKLGFQSDVTDAYVDGVPSHIMKAVKATFKPELLNRLDEIVLFNRLNSAALDRILDIQLNTLNDALAGRKVQLHYSAEVKEMLVKKGYSPEYGARPLKRVVRKLVRNVLSKKLLANLIPDGATVNVELVDGVVDFIPVKSAVYAVAYA